MAYLHIFRYDASSVNENQEVPRDVKLRDYWKW